MNNYLYRCTDCNAEYSHTQIEEEQIYLCPKCGEAAKNQPLKGVLLVEYDYEMLRKKLKRKLFLRNKPGMFWNSPELWPLHFHEYGNQYKIKDIPESMFSKLVLNSNPVNEYTLGDDSLLVFDDTRNPTLSYKDRASSLVALKAIQLGISEIAAASTGNAGSSLAGICAKLGLISHLFVPEQIPSAKRVQIQSYGANIYLVKGDYDEAFDLCLEIANENGWYNRNTAYNPLTIEGKKSAAYDMFIALDGNLPDYIFIPVGDGVIIGGIYKGLRELKQIGFIEELPKLVAVQSEKSDGLVRYLQTNKFEYKPATTIADSLNAGAPRNLYMAANAVNESCGRGVSVTDNEILNAQRDIAAEWGILAEPAAAASLAGFQKMKSEGSLPKGSTKMILLTGNGLNSD
ncbi:pyridoxal-phosphate dependent enzyme [Bacteroidota bacterium]